MKAASPPLGTGTASSRDWASLNETPTPARLRFGCSPRAGWITAHAWGSSVPRAWWSVMTHSTPISRLAATSSTERTPQSTEIISVCDAESSRMQSRCRP